MIPAAVVIVSVATDAPRDAAFYRARLADVPALSHVTIEVQHGGGADRSRAAGRTAAAMSVHH